MSLPIVAGIPSYSDLPAGGTRTFIPEIWSGKMIEKFYDATVLAAISNTDYEGEIKKHGDKVIIRTSPGAVIRNYTRGQDLVYDTPDGGKIELVIDQGKYYAATIDDVSAAQQDIKVMDKWAVEASEQMKIAIDTDVLAQVYSSAHAQNKGANAGRISQNINLGTAGAAVGLTKENIVDFLVDIGLVMDEQNIPESGRYIVLPAWAIALIKKSELKDASLTGDGTSILRNGRVGMVDRLTIYLSNLLPRAAGTGGQAAIQCTHVIAGTSKALTFATQMTAMETLRHPTKFGDLTRGLQVYGFEVIDPLCLVDAYVYKA